MLNRWYLSFSWIQYYQPVHIITDTFITNKIQFLFSHKICPALFASSSYPLIYVQRLGTGHLCQGVSYPLKYAYTLDALWWSTLSPPPLLEHGEWKRLQNNTTLLQIWEGQLDILYNHPNPPQKKKQQHHNQWMKAIENLYELQADTHYQL